MNYFKWEIGFLLLTPTLVFCESPTQMYSIRKNMRHTEVEVSIVSVDNIGERCQKESIKRGFGGFPYAVSACTFWKGKKCTIYLGAEVNNDTLGHEMRHCLQGKFH